MFDILKSYSPIMNVKPVRYPAMLLITGDHDDRVVPSHSYKFLAELQHTAGPILDQRPLMMKVYKNAGHGGGKPTRLSKQQQLDIYSFISRVTGAEWI